MNLTWWCSGSNGQPWSWTYTPFIGVWLLVAVIAGGYVLAHRLEVGGRTHRLDPVRLRRLLFGLLALFAASEWPLGPLGAGYSSTVAMVRLMLYSLVAAPLLVSAVPPWMLRAVVHRRGLRTLARTLTRWPVAFAVFNLTLVVVNAPLVVDAMKGTQLGSFVLDAGFLAASLLLWYPVFGSLEALPRLDDPKRALYVAAQAIVPIGPASFLVFSRFPIYRIYELAPPVFAGWDPLSDQQFAGITLKVIGGLGLLAYSAVLFFKWAARERDDTVAVSTAEVRRGIEDLDRWRSDPAAGGSQGG